MKILITGINGFVGKHLARELAARGCEVVGTGRNDQLDPSLEKIVARFYDCDLTDPQQVKNLPLEGIDGVISLAGLAKVGDSFGAAEKYISVNVEVLSVLCQRLLDEHANARVIAVSTGAVYESDQPMPLTEESSLVSASSPYAQSKMLMEQKAQELINKGLDCIIARPFNHIGPGQEPGFLVPDLFQKIKHASRDHAALKVGNLDTRRDYTDVRDVVKAYADLCLSPALKHRLYNVCSGRSVAGREVLDLLLNNSGVKDLQIEVDQSLIRPDDPLDIVGSARRLKADTGWQPSIAIDQTLKDFIQAN